MCLILCLPWKASPVPYQVALSSSEVSSKATLDLWRIPHSSHPEIL
jgi:hypothetical protein